MTENSGARPPLDKIIQEGCAQGAVAEARGGGSRRGWVGLEAGVYRRTEEDEGQVGKTLGGTGGKGTGQLISDTPNSSASRCVRDPSCLPTPSTNLLGPSLPTSPGLPTSTGHS